MEKKKFTKPELKIVNVAQENILQASAQTGNNPAKLQQFTAGAALTVEQSWN